MKHVQLIDIRDLGFVSMPKELGFLASKIGVKWSVTCYILRRDKNLKEAIESIEISINEAIPHEQIKESIADIHWEMIEEFRKSIKSKTFITAAWIACDRGISPTREQAYDMFKKIGAWDLPADWEEEKQLSA